MAPRPGTPLPNLVPLFLAAAATALLGFLRARVPGPSLLPALLALGCGLLVLHSLLALHLHQATAFLAGLELAYATLLLLRSQAAPLLGLGLPAFARLLAVTTPAALLLVHSLGQGRPLGARAALRAGLIVALPLLAALGLRWFPGPAAAAAGPAPAGPALASGSARSSRWRCCWPWHCSWPYGGAAACTTWAWPPPCFPATCSCSRLPPEPSAVSPPARHWPRCCAC